MSNDLAIFKTKAVTDGALWYHFDQNNSGGYFIQNDDVAADVFIQAYSAEEALKVAEEVTEPYGEYCECCGERWYLGLETGYEVPSLYRGSIFENYSPYGDGYAILYGVNGRKATFDGKTLREIN